MGTLLRPGHDRHQRLLFRLADREITPQAIRLTVEQRRCGIDRLEPYGQAVPLGAGLGHGGPQHTELAPGFGGVVPEGYHAR